MQREKVKKGVLLTLCAAAGITFVLTMAMFTSVDTVTNRFDAKYLDISLFEPHWKEQDAKNVVPDQYLPKDPYIQNVGESDAFVFLTVTMPYVDSVVLEDAQGAKLLDGNDLFMQKELFDYYINSAGGYQQNYHDAVWYELTDQRTVDQAARTVTHCYAYATQVDGAYQMTALQQKQSTETLFDAVRMINLVEGQDVEPDYIYESGKSVDELNITLSQYTIQIKAYAIQTKALSEEEELTNPEQVWRFYLDHIGLS